MEDTMENDNFIRYIIVVHGIGEQRKNETVLSVINRFAEIRAKTSPDETYEILTLGKATGQTGKDHYLDPCRLERSKSPFTPWMEFKQISKDSEKSTTGPFYGEPNDDGTQLRFVDLCWADIMQQDYPHVGQKVEDWAKGLVGRLKRKDAFEKEHGKPRYPRWVLIVVEKLAETLVFIRQLMKFRVKEMEETVFNQFLGDVQLYGEYPRTRGRAVRRFHKLMHLIDKIHNAGPNSSKTAKYTVLAHSLGTVMSMDALLYASVDENIRTEKRKVDTCPELPFPGYWIYQKETDEIEKYEKLIATEESVGIPKQDKEKIVALKTCLKKLRDKVAFTDTAWINNVDSFITLGSPIDKFLVLWWLNYEYLKEGKWGKIEEARKKAKIKHFNYTDEQDPVGHALDKFRETEAFESIFEKGEDRVFNRYVLPGVAHVKYWKDLELFQHIAHKAVDTKNPGGNDLAPKEPQWFKKSVYLRILRITYFWIPFILTLLITFIATWVVDAKDGHNLFIGYAALIITFLLGFKVINLLLWWRQIMRNKASQYFIVRKKKYAESKKNLKIQEKEKQIDPELKQRLYKELKEFTIRSWASNLAKLAITALPIGFGILSKYYYLPIQLLTNDYDSFLFIFFCSGTIVFGYAALVFWYIKIYFKIQNLITK